MNIDQFYRIINTVYQSGNDQIRCELALIDGHTVVGRMAVMGEAPMDLREGVIVVTQDNTSSVYTTVEAVVSIKPRY